jgi:hypothetical protein
LRTLVEKNDWEGIKNAPSDPPERTKEDPTTRCGAAARAKGSWWFPDARVLVIAADLCRVLPDRISVKTKKMQAQS